MKKLLVLSILAFTQLQAHCIDSKITSILAMDEEKVSVEESEKLRGLLEDLVVVKNTVESGKDCIEKSAEQMIYIIDQRNPDAPNSLMNDRLYPVYIELLDTI